MSGRTSPADRSVAAPADAARGAVYGLLATLFEEPDADLYDDLRAGRVGSDLRALTERTGLDDRVTAPDLVTDDDHDLLCARFNDLFSVGYPDPPVPLYESAYREEGDWEAVNVDLARVYDYFDVQVDQSTREHHDHLVVELEFAGYLARLAALDDDESVRRARADFLERHLLPAAEAIAEATAAEVETDIYGDLTAFLESFAAADAASLADGSSAAAGAADPNDAPEVTDP
jgi:DMSO reductase family type II enzyme chaperone